MRIYSRNTLSAFWERHPDSEEYLKTWFRDTKAAKWLSPADVKAAYAHASIINSERVVFNIAGNKFRLVVAINYEAGLVFVKFIGTHSEYDRIDVETVECR